MWRRRRAPDEQTSHFRTETVCDDAVVLVAAIGWDGKSVSDVRFRLR